MATSHPAMPFSLEAFVGSPITPVSVISFVLKPQNTFGPAAFRPIFVYFEAGNVSCGFFILSTLTCPWRLAREVDVSNSPAWASYGVSMCFWM